MTDEFLRGKVPDECIGCTKTGMEAVKCPLIGNVNEKYIFIVQCGKDYFKHNMRGTIRVSGGRFSHRPAGVGLENSVGLLSPGDKKK